MYTVKLPPHHNFHLFILVVYQYSYWKFSSVAFSLLVSFSEQFEIVWRSHISITQGVNELTKGRKHCKFSHCAHVNDSFLVDYIKNFVPLFDCYTLALWGKPSLRNTYWEQHKQFHHEALTKKSLLPVTKDKRNQSSYHLTVPGPRNWSTLY